MYLVEIAEHFPTVPQGENKEEQTNGNARFSPPDPLAFSGEQKATPATAATYRRHSRLLEPRDTGESTVVVSDFIYLLSSNRSEYFSALVCVSFPGKTIQSDSEKLKFIYFILRCIALRVSCGRKSGLNIIFRLKTTSLEQLF